MADDIEEVQSYIFDYLELKSLQGMGFSLNMGDFKPSDLEMFLAIDSTIKECRRGAHE